MAVTPEVRRAIAALGQVTDTNALVRSHISLVRRRLGVETRVCSR